MSFQKKTPLSSRNKSHHYCKRQLNDFKRKGRKETMLSRAVRPNLMGRFFSTSRVVLMDGQNIGRDSFSEKEKAQENVWIKKHEEDQLKRLKAQLEKQKDTIAKLEEEIKTTNNNKSK